MIIPECFCGTVCSTPCPFVKEILVDIKTQQENGMNKFSQYLREENLFEMANINPTTHQFGIDIKLNVMQPGNIKLSHGPRVKCFTNNSDQDFSIALNVDAEKMFLVGDYHGLITTKEFNRLFALVTKYRIPFLNMWYNPKMDSYEWKQQVDEIDAGNIVNFTKENTNEMGR